ncbi:MAG: glycosyltransferase [Planctomycetaceae bacterium]|nr:glycosyltransferase [Planctomycetaceae bacterium]
MNAAATPVWHLITGEYPPGPGGVSDYTGLVAAGLAQRGCQVEVWCPVLAGATSSVDGVTVHPLPHGFQMSGLWPLGRDLGRFPSPRMLLVQYVYNAYGCLGMNVPFCAWLVWRRVWHGDDVRVMFHEPFYSFGRQRLRRNVLALVTHVMAGLLLIAGRTIYISVPAWEPLLRPWNLLRRRMTWLPIPTTIPAAPPVETEADGPLVVGHFGTYGEQMRPGLLKLFTALLSQRSDIQFKLLGGGGKAFAAELGALVPAHAGRISAFDRLPDDVVAQEIRTCDVMLQYYPDGVSSRRTSVMACLANGVPVVTTTGWLSEPDWAESQAVSLAPADDVAAIVTTVARLLDDPAERVRLAVTGYEFYHEQFSLDRTFNVLLSHPGSCAA